MIQSFSNLNKHFENVSTELNYKWQQEKKESKQNSWQTFCFVFFFVFYLVSKLCACQKQSLLMRCLRLC